MPVWAMIITDVVLTAAAIGVFMLFDYVMPQSSGVKGEVIATVDSSAEGSFTLPNAADNSQAESTAQDDSEPAVTTTAPQAEKATTTLRTEQTNHRNWGNQDTADFLFHHQERKAYLMRPRQRQLPPLSTHRHFYHI